MLAVLISRPILTLVAVSIVIKICYCSSVFVVHVKIYLRIAFLVAVFLLNHIVIYLLMIWSHLFYILLNSICEKISLSGSQGIKFCSMFRHRYKCRACPIIRNWSEQVLNSSDLRVGKALLLVDLLLVIYPISYLWLLW